MTAQPAVHTRRAQAALLTRRYVAVLAGDPLTVLLLVGQAPFIGWLCAIVWGSIETDTPSLWFVMCLSAMWFGCISACREIVKERPIVERERFFGLSIPAYVASKLAVLSGLGLVQIVLLQAAVEWQIALRGAYLLQTLALWGAATCGVALGLLVSALSRQQERAVGAVPLLLLPQILFSEFAIPADQFGDAVAAIERLMPVRHAYLVFKGLGATDTQWTDALIGLGGLTGTTLVLSVLTALAMTRRHG